VTLQSGRSSTIQRNIPPPSSGSKSRPSQRTVSRVICVLLPIRFLLGLLFNPDDGGGMLSLTTVKTSNPTNNYISGRRKLIYRILEFNNLRAFLKVHEFRTTASYLDILINITPTKHYVHKRFLYYGETPITGFLGEHYIQILN
jgi:hypothetical protein